MKINWKVRLKNPYFYLSLVIAIAGPVGLTFGINFEDLTSWPIVWEITKKAFFTPYLVITVFISVVTFLIDPTTKGLNDSPQALQYKEPK
ncbi:phage holin [Psychrobacillus psychrodurans]|uniref:phage holin n=1 Tax=Psychrobacillus psychrodurans TaxID=126157 RepID=UPI001F4E405D|nr:phage holin [Psychrobacillus psychrodurans]MCK1998943.1 phage holin [Psychrobacillus psychrodurans]